MDTTQLYNGKEVLYDMYRPDYPSEIINIFGDTKDFVGKQVADIGAGTGRLSERFLEHNFKVFGIEPNESMVKIMRKKYCKHNTFKAMQGTSESTNLPEKSIDVVAFGQSFHWCDTPHSIAEINRIIKPGGKIFICWNNKKEETDRFNLELEQILLRLFPLYRSNKNILYDADMLKKKFNPKHMKCEIIDHHQVLDLEGVFGRFESNSYFVQQHKNEFCDCIEDLFSKCKMDGFVKINYSCHIFLLEF